MVFNKFSSLLVTGALILGMVMVAGCATPGPVKSTATIAPPPAEVASSVGWWHARFRMDWSQGEEPSWHIDLLIAHKIVAPTLDLYRSSILLWRFHRRAVRDETGHQFSFIFYASADTAYQVLNRLRSNELLTKLKFAEIILEDIYDPPDKNAQPWIEDTSDPNWPPSIKRSWPYYIMGVSQMWLKLISETVDDIPKPSATLSLTENLQFYKIVNSAISSLWEKNGRHAFLHHLNALFGYKSIIYYEKLFLNF